MVEALQELLQKNYQAEKDFLYAMEHADEVVLKDFCKKGSLRHNHYATTIDKLLHELNEHPGNPQDHLGLGHAWTNFKSSIGKHRDEVLLEECRDGEKKALKEYQKKLKDHRFATHIEEELQKQSQEIEKVLSDVKDMEDLRW